MVQCSSSSESSFWEGRHRVGSEVSSPRALAWAPLSASKLLGDFGAKGPALWLRTRPRRGELDLGLPEEARSHGGSPDGG